jgi:hypothetical protein
VIAEGPTAQVGPTQSPGEDFDVEGSRAERDAYADVGAAIRGAHLRFVRAGLGTFDRRVLDAVVCVVASYSRIQDKVTVTQIARWVYDRESDDVLGWQRQRVQQGLSRLAKAGVILYEAPRGRAPGGRERNVFVSLRKESHAQPGARSEDVGRALESSAEVSACSEAEDDTESAECALTLSRNARSTGGHTEKCSEENDNETIANKEGLIVDSVVACAREEELVEKLVRDLGATVVAERPHLRPRDRGKLAKVSNG